MNSSHATPTLKAIDLDRVQRALTSKKWDLIYRDSDTCPKTLLDALQSELVHVAPQEWKARFELGGMHINGRAAPALDSVLPVPCRIEYFEPTFNIEKASEHFPQFDDCPIIFQDEDLIVVWKPAGLPCLPNREQKHYHLKGYLEEQLNKKVHLPSRLDTSTRGVVAVSTSARMHNWLQQAYEKRRAEKFYLLQTSGLFTANALDITEPIGFHHLHPVLRAVNGTDCKKSRTLFHLLSHSDNADSPRSVVLAKPYTGRTHQIRVHARHLELPIIGDNFYSGHEANSLHLVSYRLRLTLPHASEPFDFIAPDAILPEWVGKSNISLAKTISHTL